MERLNCTIEGCNNGAASRKIITAGGSTKVSYRKLCLTHHRKKYGMSLDTSYDKRIRDSLGEFDNRKCVSCGKEVICDRHRIVSGKDGGEYVVGNVISLCKSCHMRLHKLEERERFDILEKRVTLLEAENALLRATFAPLVL